MSTVNDETPRAPGEEPELNDETLEQVAGGCQWGDSNVDGSCERGSSPIEHGCVRVPQVDG